MQKMDELDEESCFGLDRFCIIYVDRGVALGQVKYTRVNECIHRLHKICAAIVKSLNFEVELTLICHAANFCASAPEFSRFLKEEYRIEYTEGFLWQRATTGRFATAWAACFCCSADVGKSRTTVLEVLVRYLPVRALFWRFRVGLR